MAIRSSRIVWTNGPFLASYHDISVFCGGKADKSPSQWSQKSLYHQLPDGIKCVADSSYGLRLENCCKESRAFASSPKFCRVHGKSTEMKMNLNQTVFVLLL